ncbi:AAA family ATPase [Pseudanabaena sp. PCC 6802]|uniref:AAA family ATPase n=1 Tax=Pseudanabaena sp. PCC 6802 TaxID=118173 RepID=UPI000344B94F|nr:AAA family ATPase [Pseudanabaena sp. PCC 6802]
MSRWFNTAGPCKPDIHYMLAPLDRLPQVQDLIDQQSYFVIHAPRQTGKTTAITTLAQQLTARGRYAAVMVTVEGGAPFGDDIGAAERAILRSWYENAEDSLPIELAPPQWEPVEPGQGIRSALRSWSNKCPRPLIVFIDEIDALQGQTLLSVLRQLRDGYGKRPDRFPQSVALVGLRDVRDYKIATSESDRLNTSSPFNIKVESLTLRNFTEVEVAQLYQQHTSDTGQSFTSEAIARAYELTQGQPWLVNAIARQAVQTIVPDPTIPVTLEVIDRAKEILIQRQDTHLDSLAERLREPRVKSIVEPILAGQLLGDTPDDDRRYLIDLGLIQRDGFGGLVIANPIYREVIPRALAQSSQDSLPTISPTWLQPDGELNPGALLQSFLRFWRQHGEPMLNSAAYHEIAPHLVLMAFLHRVVNGGGTLEREYAIGSDRMDLCLRYGDVTLGLELKVWRDRRPDPLAAGLEQLDSYLGRLGLTSGWLVIFDRRSHLPPIEERTTTETAETSHGREITVIRG